MSGIARPKLIDEVSISELHSMRNRMSIKDMATSLGVSVNTLYKYLNGYKAQKPTDEETGTRVQVKPAIEAVAEPAPEIDTSEIIKNARERFNSRMGMESNKTKIEIESCRYRGAQHTFEVRGGNVFIMNENDTSCTLSLDKVDDFIAELRQVAKSATAINIKI